MSPTFCFQSISRRILQDQNSRPDVAQMREYMKHIDLTINEDSVNGGNKNAKNADSRHITDIDDYGVRVEHTTETTHSEIASHHKTSIEIKQHKTLRTRTASTESDDLDREIQEKLNEKQRMTSKLHALEVEINRLKIQKSAKLRSNIDA